MNFYKHIWVVCTLLFISACDQTDELSPFTSDGCSLFPDASFISADDWCSCCYAHDIAYWQGGTADQRLAADEILKTCVIEKTENEALAQVMYEGVRLGGSPYFYTWYRWGYGWSFDRKYLALSEEDELKVQNELAKIQPSQGICNKGTDN